MNNRRFLGIFISFCLMMGGIGGVIHCLQPVEIDESIAVDEINIETFNRLVKDEVIVDKEKNKTYVDNDLVEYSYEYRDIDINNEKLNKEQVNKEFKDFLKMNSSYVHKDSREYMMLGFFFFIALISTSTFIAMLVP